MLPIKMGINRSQQIFPPFRGFKAGKDYVADKEFDNEKNYKADRIYGTDVISAANKSREALAAFINANPVSVIMRKASALTLTKRQTTNMPNEGLPVQKFIEGLRSSMSKGISDVISGITSRFKGENYDELVNSFLPDGATLLNPLYPEGSNGIRIADFDGDSADEIAASYKYNNGVNTVILKKQNNQWTKAAEIENPGYDYIKHTAVANLTGEDRQNLIIGLVSKDKGPVLHGFSLEGNSLREIFNIPYYYMEVFSRPQNRPNQRRLHQQNHPPVQDCPQDFISQYQNRPRDQNSQDRLPAKPAASLALWNTEDRGIYSIDVLNWNGEQLEYDENASPYFYNRVIPYHIQKIKRNPGSSSDWYNLAKALNLVGRKREALTAIEAGMYYGNGKVPEEMFAALKNEIME